MVERQPGNGDAAPEHQARDKGRQPHQCLSVEVVIARADIGVDKRRALSRESRGGCPDLSQYKISLVGDAAQMCSQRPVEGDDSAAGKVLAEVIVRAAIAQAEFQNRATYAR